MHDYTATHPFSSSSSSSSNFQEIRGSQEETMEVNPNFESFIFNHPQSSKRSDKFANTKANKTVEAELISSLSSISLSSSSEQDNNIFASTFELLNSYPFEIAFQKIRESSGLDLEIEDEEMIEGWLNECPKVRQAISHYLILLLKSDIREEAYLQKDASREVKALLTHIPSLTINLLQWIEEKSSGYLDKQEYSPKDLLAAHFERILDWSDDYDVAAACLKVLAIRETENTQFLESLNGNFLAAWNEYFQHLYEHPDEDGDSEFILLLQHLKENKPDLFQKIKHAEKFRDWLLLSFQSCPGSGLDRIQREMEFWHLFSEPYMSLECFLNISADDLNDLAAFKGTLNQYICYLEQWNWSGELLGPAFEHSIGLLRAIEPQWVNLSQSKVKPMHRILEHWIRRWGNEAFTSQWENYFYPQELHIPYRILITQTLCRADLNPESKRDAVAFLSNRFESIDPEKAGLFMSEISENQNMDDEF